MNVLAPMAFWGAVLAIPIAMAYLVRQRARRMQVGNFLLWSTPPARLRDSAFWHRLRSPLSLLLQLVFLALLLLALAQLQWSNPSAPSAVVFVLDRSVSMQATDEPPSRFAGARQAVKDAIAALPGSTRVAVLATGGAPVLVSGWTTRRRAALDALDRLEAAGEAISPHDTLRLARALARQAGGSVVLVTDGVGDGVWDGGALEGVQVVRVGADAANSGVVAFAARRSPAIPGEVSVLATVGRSQSGQGGTFELWKDGSLVDVRNPDLADGSPWTGEWTFQSDSTFHLRAALSPAAGDVLATDASFTLSLPPLPPLDVVLISEPDRYLEAALAAVPSVRTARIPPGEAPAFGDPTKVYVFRGAEVPDDFQAAGILLIAPAEGGFFGERVGDVASVVGDTVEGELPGFARISALGRVEAPVFRPVPGARVLVDGEGRPLIFGDWEGARKWMVIAFEPSRSGLVDRPAFPILVGAFLQAVRGSEPAAVAPASRAVTRLEARVPEGAGHVDGVRRGVFGVWEIWTWLLLAAVVWLFVEWHLYHRRVTE